MTDDNKNRYAKPDAERFSGKPRINKIKPDNIAAAGEHAAWAVGFAEAFTAALPSLQRGMRSWVVGVKVVAKGGSMDGKLFLRLKVSNGGRGTDDKRRWIYVTLGSSLDPVELAKETADSMAKQPHKRQIGPAGMIVTV